ncbi:16S rRNA (guanine(527)-N(7))-methyltransferase RsmG [Calidithermus roseus]|uniref:Ribosomal RNA small subunit methyltransferase G n=1 Tax=Calidithermus roseus TaxID=1644118 RepID=A0A399EJ24_9DEIN|nr:16S rRNA (guanine(527)-N(7))-methyltransferase RsmG [Calidithermus roseus]RIH83433.1 Ribosomal RNA small subunit methyltransferase G [Calidithermus roseus]
MRLTAAGRELLLRGAATLGEDLSPTIHLFERLYARLTSVNQKINLTSLREERDIVLKHFLDSLTCLTSGLLEGPLEVVDVGTGAGFPGLPLKIVRPSLRMHLLEATRKKLRYVEETCALLGLKGTAFIWGRAEQVAHQPEYRERFDRAVIRAVGPMGQISELCLPLLKVGGYLIAQKGPEVAQELEGVAQGLKPLGGVLEEVKELELPESGDQRRLVIIKKVAATEPRYPRRPEVIARHGLF